MVDGDDLLESRPQLRMHEKLGKRTGEINDGMLILMSCLVDVLYEY